MIKHILVPYDGSKPSHRAFEYALDLAKKYKSNVTVITCLYKQYYDPNLYEMEDKILKKRERDAATTGLLNLEAIADELEIPFKAKILESFSVTDALLSYAESHGIDLIIMGSRGMGGFKKLLLGSVASGVTEHSKCPVLIVK